MNNELSVAEETRQRVLDAIAKLNYVANPAARSLRGASRNINLVVPGLNFADYVGEVVKGIFRASDRSGYSLELFIQNEMTAEQYERYMGLFRPSFSDGVLMVVPYNHDMLLHICRNNHLPYVMVDYQGTTLLPDEPVILSQDKAGIIGAMDHLLAMGHTRIGFITGLLEMHSARERLQGYKDALHNAGLPVDPELVVEGDFGQKTGFEQTLHLLQKQPSMTAIMASNDMMALGAMNAIREFGLRIGDDVSVIGFDDIGIAAQWYPTLTTVRQQMSRMGEAAVDLLIGLIEGKQPESRQIKFVTELVIRQSTGKARSGVTSDRNLYIP